jgi:hypothetical protein
MRLIVESSVNTIPEDMHRILVEELPPLLRILSRDSLVLTRESILAKLAREDIRKDLVNLPGISR